MALGAEHTNRALSAYPAEAWVYSRYPGSRIPLIKKEEKRRKEGRA
jgi:hypothetical protein